MTKEEIHGYDDVVFFERPSFEVSCSICLQTLKDPVQVNPCGHRFCNDCIEKVKTSRGILTLLCPIDKGEIQNTFPDKGMERMILNLEIKCTKNDKGCIWTGEFRELEVHLKDCGYLEITCTNDNCESKMERHHLQNHLCGCLFRKVECEHCSEDYIYIDKEIHDDQCRKLPLKCQNNCGEDILRDEMDEHVKEECQNTIHPCKYRKIGCQEKGTRARLQEHLETDIKTHISYAVEKLEDYEVRLSQQSEQLENLQKSLSQQNDKITILTRLCDNLYKSKSRDIELRPFKVTINNFRRKIKSDIFDDWISSDPFYCLDGYRSQVCIALKDNCTKFVSIYFGIIKGPFDDLLSWPFRGIVKFSVQGKANDDVIDMKLDTTKPPPDVSQWFQKPTTEMSASWGFKFLSRDLNKYVINDTLTITCDVKPPK